MKKVVLVFAQGPISASFFLPEEDGRCLCLWTLVSTNMQQQGLRESVQPILANELALGMRGSREHDIADHPICMAIDLSVVKR